MVSVILLLLLVLFGSLAVILFYRVNDNFGWIFFISFALIGIILIIYVINNPTKYQGKTMDNKIVNFTSHDQRYRDRTTITVDGRTYKLKEYWKVGE